MAKILYKPEKKEFVKEINKEVVISKKRTYYISDLSKDFVTEDGKILKKDLIKKDGSILKTNKGKKYVLFSSDFTDDYKRIERKAQIITLKDIGYILAETGLDNKSRVVDAGTGSGALACFLARICKEVTSYDIRDDAIEVAEKNKKFLNINNLKIKKKDIFKGIDEKNLDLIVLDMPEPFNAIKSCEKSLRIGGYLVVYLPTVLQIHKFVNEIKKNNNFIYIKTIELIERSWKIDTTVARPSSDSIGHTAFMAFFRKI